MPAHDRASASIIITCYNYGRYLGEAIESALAQTVSAHEIIVVNDGSTDDSQLVAERYAEQSSRVHVINQTNQGIVTACNNGIAAASGTFFVRLDADDRLDPQYLAHTIPVLQSYPCKGYAYTSYRYFGALDDTMHARRFSLRDLIFRPFITATALVRRQAYLAAGGYSVQMKRAYEDWDFYLSLAEQGWFGIAIPEILFYYRQHTGSRNSLTFSEWLAVMKLLYERHCGLHHQPQALFLSRAIADRAWRMLC